MSDTYTVTMHEGPFNGQTFQVPSHMSVVQVAEGGTRYEVPVRRNFVTREYIAHWGDRRYA